MKYSVILADPPWGYQNWTDAKNGAAVSAYPVLKDKDIIELPVGNIAEKDSMLFLWCTWPKLEIGLAAMKAWGFKYVTCVHDWVKTTKNGESLHHGIGFWALGGSEFVLMGRRGKGLPRCKQTRGRVKQVHMAPVTKHSEKPEELHEKIGQLLWGGPAQQPPVNCIEIFARREPPHGWDATGLDYDGKDIREFLTDVD